MHALPGADKVLTHLAALLPPPCVHTTTGPRLRNTRERALFHTIPVSAGPPSFTHHASCNQSVSHLSQKERML